MVGQLPFPLLLNEESLNGFPSRRDFLAALQKLANVIGRMRYYGFALQVGCSRRMLERPCYEGVSFFRWLTDKGVSDAEERSLQAYFRNLIAKVPRFEEGYAGLVEEPSFDLYWSGRRLYMNPERTIPAFLVAISFKVPSVAFDAGIFHESCQFSLRREFARGDTLDSEDETSVAISKKSDLEAFDRSFGLELQMSVLDGGHLLAHSGEFLPHVCFSQEAVRELPTADLRRYPVVSELITLQKRFVECEGGESEFWSKYGRCRTYASDESETTHHHYPLSRRFTWPDGKRDCWPHLKLGKKFRISFSLDFAQKKIYVGYVGPHLPV